MLTFVSDKRDKTVCFPCIFLSLSFSRYSIPVLNDQRLTTSRLREKEAEGTETRSDSSVVQQNIVQRLSRSVSHGWCRSR